MAFDPEQASAVLTAADPVMGALIASLGPMHRDQRMRGETFPVLLRAIVYQQLSGKAAGTIHGRVLALFGERQPAAAALAGIGDDALRGAGLSANKLRALRDLAAKCQDGTVPAMRSLRRLDDEAIIQRLTAVRGVGRWTVEMLLIFRLRRPDVLSATDLGIRKGYAVVYGCGLPAPAELARIGQAWAPYRSVASWYLWRAAEQAG